VSRHAVNSSQLSEHTTKPSATGEIMPRNSAQYGRVQTSGHVGRGHWK